MVHKGGGASLTKRVTSTRSLGSICPHRYTRNVPRPLTSRAGNLADAAKCLGRDMEPCEEVGEPAATKEAELDAAASLWRPRCLLPRLLALPSTADPLLVDLCHNRAHHTPQATKVLGVGLLSLKQAPHGETGLTAGAEPFLFRLWSSIGPSMPTLFRRSSPSDSTVYSADNNNDASIMRRTEYGNVEEVPAKDTMATELPDPRTSLHRGLKARHITMIAIGGAIGTGLIIGTGSSLARAGPASILISYSAVGFLVYMVMCALGEMAAWLPLASGFTGYAARFCDPALGFALGWTYWFNINYFGGVRFFGEFEFWLSSIKVIVIIGVILLSLVLAAGGGPDHDPKGFRYWSNPGAFATYIDDGAAGRFYAFWSVMVTAVFAFLGTELVGVTVGEAQNPRRAIPKAIKLTFWRIVIFYICSVFLLGMIVPYNTPALAFANNQKNTSAAASPFVVAVTLAGIPYLDGILNGAILIFVFSAANSDLYIATRTIYGLASEGKAPAFLKRTDRNGVPFYALGVSSLFALLAYLNVADDSKKVFTYFVNLVSMFGLLTWISILVSHIYFVRARKAQGIPNSALAFVAPFGAAGSYGALAFCILISLTKNFDVFTNAKSKVRFDYETFITGYLGIPLYLVMIAGYKLFTREAGVKAATADLFGGKDIIDREEEEFLANKAREMEERKASGKGNARWYRFVEWLF
ncbi:hypothetical protein FH972_023191 [Carpinus fangiana]|uniref:Amino acid permease/ SLC12A domain-containing protein n=1 Tax=Carpinus fangiana TaxID=176857 RepID=A0A5N6KWR1_9ROSI|nr:hypothetical protein FH972_023191 [Carpinus fangiana]